jgi:hypothetical protein
VTNAEYWSDRLGEPRRSARIVAVNQRRTQILAQHQEVDPWAGLGGSAEAATQPAGGAETPAGPPPPPA